MNVDRRASLLFVAGGEDVQRDVFRTHRMGYWSAAFDVLLEKHGWLDFDRAEPEILEDAEALRRYEAVIVAWLPARYWKPSYLRSLRAYDGVLFLEGPLPPMVEGLAGLSRVAGGRALLEAEVEPGEAMRAAIERLRPVLGDGPVRVHPKDVVTRPAGHAREDFHAAASAGESVVDRLPGIAVSYALAYKARAAARGTMFPDPAMNAIATLALSELVAKAEGPIARELAQAIPGWTAELGASDAASRASSAAWTSVSARVTVVDHPPSRADALALLLASRPGAPAELPSAWRLWLGHLAREIEQGPDLASLEGWRLPELLLLAGALSAIGERPAAESLAERSVETLFDQTKGSFRNGSVAAGRISSTSGYAIVPSVLLGLVELCPRIVSTDSAADARVGYTRAQVDAWAAPPYWIEPYENVGGTDEMRLETVDGARAGIARRGRILSSGFQILAYLVHAHTMQPLEEPLWDCPLAEMLAIEHALFGLLDVTLQRCGRSTLAVAPWPWGARYCLTVRHDVDRIPAPDRFERLVAFEREHGLAVSWYWLPNRLEPTLLRRIADEGHEIGLHSLRTARKAEEISALRAASPAEVGIEGEAIHGAPGSDQWLGHPSVRAARAAGLRYTNVVPTVFDHPLPAFPALGHDGTIERVSIVGVTHSVSTDVGGRDSSILERRLERLLLFASSGFACQILNHPDIGFEDLRTWIDRLPDDRVDWTYAQLARWWAATHDRASLRIVRVEAGPSACVYEIEAHDDVADLAIRTQIAPAAVVGVDLDGRPAEWRPMAAADGAGTFIRLSLAAGHTARLAITHRRQPRYEDVAAATPEFPGRARLTPDYQLTRASLMAQVITSWTPHRDLAGLTIADAGCGFGAFLLAFHLNEQPARTIGIDLNDRYVQIGHDLIEQLGVERIAIEHADMADLDRVVAGADVVTVNNAIHFAGRQRFEAVLGACFRALRPGGALVVLTPNRLHYRAAHTQLVGVQWLPRGIARRYARLRGRDPFDGAADADLPSPFELTRLARRAGFERPLVIDAYRLTTAGRGRYFKPRFYLTAVKPSDA